MSTTAIVIYNGTDRNIISDMSTSNVSRIGYEDSERLAREFAKLANCPKELLFGEPKYGRSYGGASNLLLAVGCALGASVLAKVDDDCLDYRPSTDSWLSNALRLAKLGGVHFGPYYGHPSGFLYRLPKDTAVRLAQFNYANDEHSERLDFGTKGTGKVIKNGNLVFARSVAMSACYPVLFEPRTQTHVRGEIYFWKHDLNELGVSFTYQQALGLGHYPPGEKDINSWLRSIVVGFDLAFVHRTYRMERRQATDLERRDAISQFQAWILKTEWPEGVAADEIAALLEDIAPSFAEKVLHETPARELGWRRLMSSDLGKAIQETLPELVRNT